MKALDLFCGGGGAARGILAAGFDQVVGIDIADHRKSYPGHFILGDALCPPVRLEDFDFVWASPPCQRFSQGNNVNKGVRDRLVNHIPATRKLISSHPFTCIENVPRAPIRHDVTLTGIMVGLPKLLRKRHFELSWFCLYSPVVRTPGRIGDGSLIPVMKNGSPMIDSRMERERNGLSRYVKVQEMRDAMGCPETMNRHEVGEAVPPAYAEFIARAALEAIRN